MNQPKLPYESVTTTAIWRHGHHDCHCAYHEIPGHQQAGGAAASPRLTHPRAYHHNYYYLRMTQPASPAPRVS